LRRNTTIVFGMLLKDTTEDADTMFREGWLQSFAGGG